MLGKDAAAHARGDLQRLFLAALLISLWLTLLLVGWAFGGATHLLLVAGLAVVPWRTMARHLTDDERQP